MGRRGFGAIIIVAAMPLSSGCSGGDTGRATGTTTDGLETTTVGASEMCVPGEPIDDPDARTIFDAAESVLPAGVVLSGESVRSLVDAPNDLEVSLFVCSETLSDAEAVDLALDLAKALDGSAPGGRIVRMGVNLFAPMGGRFAEADGQVIAASFSSYEWGSTEADRGALRAGLDLRR